MTTRTTLRTTPLLALVVFTACSSSERADELSAGDVASEITKRIHPDGSSAAFELVKPSWATDDYRGDFGLLPFPNGTWMPIPFGRSIDTTSALQGQATTTIPLGFHPFSGMPFENIKVERGYIARYTPAGISVQYEKPISPQVEFATPNSWAIYTSASTRGAPLWDRMVRSESGGIRFYTLAGHYKLMSLYDGDSSPFDILEGQKVDVTLPVTTITTEFDPISPDFPGAGSCGVLSIGDSNPLSGRAHNVNATIRSQRASPTVIVPAGRRISLFSDCDKSSVPLAAGATITLKFHRLEIDDIGVADPSGITRMVRGSFTVARASSPTDIVARGLTHMGIDLPAGEYVVQSTSGAGVLHVAKVTLP